jgi:hypothetical protein
MYVEVLSRFERTSLQIYDQGVANALVAIVRLCHEDGAVDTNPHLTVRKSDIHFTGQSSFRLSLNLIANTGHWSFLPLVVPVHQLLRAARGRWCHREYLYHKNPILHSTMNTQVWLVFHRRQ